MNKKENQKKEVGAANMLRFTNTDLIERLNKRYNEDGSRYKDRNHFFTDLIEAGLDRREYENSLRDELLKNDAAMYKSVDELAGAFMEFAKYVRTQFQTIQASDMTIKWLLGGIYNIMEATHLRKNLLQEHLDRGIYDGMPHRFMEFEERAERRYIKDE